MKSRHFISALALNVVLLASCATYNPLPLNSKPSLSSKLPSNVDPAKPLTASDVARLTLQLNPDLNTARNDRALGKAQAIQADILPNPQFNGSYSFLLGGPGMFDAYTLGLTEDIRALIVRGAAKKSAAYDSKKIDADLLWQEWQTLGKAQLLYVDLVEMQKQRDNLAENLKLFADRYAKSHAAMMRGDVDLTVTAPDLAAKLDMEKQLADLDRQLQSKWQDLDALLSLEPTVRFPLSPNINLVPIDETKLRETLSHLGETRPDLVALNYGYQSQEEKLRGAILGQFPALVFGGNYGTDTSHVFTGGPSVTLDLPIFNHNQGNIAIETETRQKLHDEYTNRLNAANGEVKAMLSSYRLQLKQYNAVKVTSKDAIATGRSADNAYKAGNIDERAYIDLKSTEFSQRQQLLALEQSLLEQQVALTTLVGVGMPALAMPKGDK